MNPDAACALERRIAAFLAAGTWLASLVIAAGLAVPAAAPLVKGGVALFIALPIARVALMLVAFVRQQDYRIGIVSVLVLVIILLGIALGASTSGQGTLGFLGSTKNGPPPATRRLLRVRAEALRPEHRALQAGTQPRSLNLVGLDSTHSYF